ncbi:MAG: DUF559 domain-containing protein [Solirubrobacterales bacterium]
MYCVGYSLLPIKGHWKAAVLACGPEALLSHRSAAALLGVRPSHAKRIDVSAPDRRGRRRPGLNVHEAGSISDHDRGEVDGIAVTGVARTLLDLAAVLPPDAVRRACEQAEIRRLFDLASIRRVIAENTGRRGVDALRTVIDDLAEPEGTRGELEDRFLGLCRAAGLPRPRVNALVTAGGARFEVDFSWPGARLIVEADSRRYHATGSAFERDRRRDQALTLAGWRVIRCTWRQVTGDPRPLAATVGALLRD